VLHDCFAGRDQATAYAMALGFHRFGLRLEDKVGAFVVPSEFVRRRTAEWGFPPERVRMIRNFAPMPADPGSPGTGGLFLGRLSGEKGAADLLDALAVAGDPPFEIAGDGPDDLNLRDQARRLGLANTRFLGRLDRPEVDAALRRAGYVVVPSRSDETASLAAIEALAAGRALVATRVGGLPELAADGRGEAVPPQDPAALGAAIARVVADPGRVASQGRAAAAFAAAELSANAHRSALQSLYADLVAARVGHDDPRPREALQVGEAEAELGATTPVMATRRTVQVAPPPPVPPTRVVTPVTGPGRRRPTVLMVHCYYRELGGENLSFDAEVALLRAHGHRVIEYTRDNRDIGRLTLGTQGRLAVRTIWGADAYGDVAAIIRRERPDLVHLQNTFPQISPAVAHAASRLGVPVVQTLRNYRIVCAAGTFYRDGKVCEDCMDKPVGLPGLVHRCYNGSVTRTGVVVALQAAHRALGTWTDAVDRFITPSSFARSKLIEAGVPADRLVVKPNFVDPDPGVGDGPRTSAVFVGRLSIDKGIMTMLEAWRLARPLPLEIVGDGPLRPTAEAFVREHGLESLVTFHGVQPPAEVMRTMRHARLVLVPSELYETFGRVVVEAFACGVPVVASRLGAMQELIEEGGTGRLHGPGDAQGLADAVADALADPDELAAMGRRARAAYEQRYTAAANYDRLLEIYAEALAAPAAADARAG
jgi:glycosyltransferase involved in cell wall biosynthesis